MTSATTRTPAEVARAAFNAVINKDPDGIVGVLYLAKVSYNTVRGITHHRPVYTGHTGGAPATAPARPASGRPGRAPRP